MINYKFIIKEHTGAREMGIQRAHGAILVYSACSTDSLQWITEVSEDFSKRKDKHKVPFLHINKFA